MTDFAVVCPHCHRSNGDPFEVFTRNAVDWDTCVGCKQAFHYLLAECDACEEETVFAWREEPIGIAISDMECSSCGEMFGHGEQTQGSAGSAC